MSNEIMKQEVNAPSLIADDVPASDLILPRLALLQGLSEPVKSKQAEAGTWHNNIMSENYGATVEVIPVKLTHGAILFRRGEGMVCKSNDGLTSIYGDTCKQCPHNVFHAGEWRDNKRPECSSTLDIVVLERKSLIPMVLTFKISTYKTGKLIATNMKLRGMCSVVLGGKMQDDNYAPTINGYRKITQDELEVARTLRQQLMTANVTYAEETPAAPAREPGSDDVTIDDLL